jgi:hypothetical protein
MAVPNIFGTATSAIPLSQLDQNFATAITLGNTAVYLGNTTTSLGNVTLTNVTISSGTSNIAANVSTAVGLLPETNGGTGTTTGYYGFKNRIINGAMVIDQRNAGASVSVVSGTSPYIVDRFIAYNNATNTYTVQQSSTTPAGFSTSVLITNNASATSNTAGMYQLFAQRIEGYNIADLNWGSANASSVTLSFWVYTSQAGTYGGVLRNGANTRFYAFSFTVTANTWTKINIPIVGDTSGTWATNNTTGIELIIALSCGSGLTVATGSWGGTVALGATGQTQFNATGSATFYITGVQLEKGSTATSFDFRSIGTELALCQRYYYLYVSGTGQFISSGWMYDSLNFGCGITFPVTMRTAPTLVSTTGTNYYGFDRNGATDGFNSLSISRAQTNGTGFFNNSEVSGTAGNAGVVFTNNAASSIALNSEL